MCHNSVVTGSSGKCWPKAACGAKIKDAQTIFHGNDGKMILKNF